MAISLDGTLSDWSPVDRLDRPGTGTSGYQLFGRTETDGVTGARSFVFALHAPEPIGAATTFWLNTDQDAATGYQIFGTAGGAEFNVNFVDADQDPGAEPYLYTGADGESFVAGPLEHASSTDGMTVEFAVPLELLVGETDGVADVLVDVNNVVFLPGDYGLPPYTIRPPVVPPADTGLRIGIVYSETSAANFFDETAYSQLFRAAQNQAGMAGIPFDILTEADLTDLDKLVTYDALVFPSMQNVRAADAAAIQGALGAAVSDYGVGLVTAGNFLTNDENGNALGGDPYARMKALLGIALEGSALDSTVTVTAGDIAHPVMQGYAAGEVIRTYTGVGTQFFQDLTGEGSVLARQTVNGQVENAVLATSTGGRNVHFATEGMLADNNMLEDALGWAARDPDQPVLSLQMSRQAALFASRSDMDQAQEVADVNPDTGPGIYDVLLPILEQWKATYNFVGSYYIDIGDNPPDQTTDWAVSKPYYDRLLAMGNEIGSHSWTHPEDTNALTDAQLAFEFGQSKAEIEARLGIAVAGAAIPGAPESLEVSQKVLQYYAYLSGGNAQIGAGYPGAFGVLTPSDTKIYLAPNISSDFTLAGFQGRTPDQVAEAWAQEWQAMTAHADLPVIVFPWHDYGPTAWEAGYTRGMFESLIGTAYDAGAEFVTLQDLAERISAFQGAGLTYALVDDGTVEATVGPAGLGTFALDLDGGDRIASVSGWYAYDEDSVFLPESGGTYTIHLGAVPDDVTHITSLPSRARLLTTSSPGEGGLDFSVIGEGRVVVDLLDSAAGQVSVTGAEVVGQTGDRLELNLTGLGRHDVAIRLQQQPVSSYAVAPTTATATEGAEDVAGALVFTVTRTGSTAAAESVTYGLGGTATPGADYAAPAGSVAFAAGQATATVTLATLADDLAEGDETVTLTLTGASAGGQVSAVPATGTIRDVAPTPGPTPTYALSGAPTVDEGGVLVFAVTRSLATAEAQTVDLGLRLGAGSTATAGTDFTVPATSVAFEAGALTAEVRIDTAQDAVAEGDETVVLALGAGAAVTPGGSAEATGTIRDVAPTPGPMPSTDWAEIGRVVQAFFEANGYWASYEDILAMNGGPPPPDPDPNPTPHPPAQTDWAAIAAVVNAFFEANGYWASYEDILAMSGGTTSTASALETVASDALTLQTAASLNQGELLLM